MKVINFAFHNKEYTTYFKTQKVNIREKGRWGPKWMHALVYRMAKNLGMLYNDIGENSTVNKVRIDFQYQYKDLLKEISKNVLKYIRSTSYNIDEIVCLIGTGEFEDIMYNVAHNYPLVLDTPIYQNGFRYNGINVIIVPYMEGIVIVPKKDLIIEKR